MTKPTAPKQRCAVYTRKSNEEGLDMEFNEAVHKGQAYPGEHKPIIDRKLWESVRAVLQKSPRKRAATARSQTSSLLKGLIYDASGAAMSPTHPRRRGRLYRYYTSQ